jgi:hypothetical protein
MDAEMEWAYYIGHMHVPGGGSMTIIRWGAEGQNRNRANVAQRYLLCGADLLPALFRTRREARAWIEREYGYIRRRPDLRAEPHGWRMPVAVRVEIRRVGR